MTPPEPNLTWGKMESGVGEEGQKIGPLFVSSVTQKGTALAQES